MSLQRWTRWTEWPLAGAAMVFLVAYSWQVIGELHGPADAAANVVLNLTWLVFVADYVARLILARFRWGWIWRHAFDLAVVALPALRPLRLLRLVTLLSILNRVTGRMVRGRVIVYAIAASSLLVYVAAVAELDAERAHGDIRTIWDALWWAFVTITTVGYGDYTPVTFVGRLVAVGVMIGGITLIGVVTATLASWIVERVAAATDAAARKDRSDIELLRDEIAALRTELVAQRVESPGAADR
jgi:voltage-gated potassium channel